MSAFKGASVGQSVYYLDKQALKAGKGVVRSVSSPRIQSVPTVSSAMVIDVVIAIDGVERTYTMSDNASIAYAGDVTLSLDKESIVSECTKLRDEANDALSKVDQYKLVIDSYSSLIDSLCPEEAEKKAMSERLSRLEDSVKQILNLLNK